MERPTKPYSEVRELLQGSSKAFEKLVSYIRTHYIIDEIWIEGKPTHKHRNNLYFKRSGKSLITLQLHEGHFLAALVFGKAEREKFEHVRATFSPEIIKEYDAAEVLHDGKWFGWYIYDETLIDEIIQLLPLKRKPNRKELPNNPKDCGTLDIGLSGAEITEYFNS